MKKPKAIAKPTITIKPRSKGCARLFPWHQDRLLRWLGLDDITEATWNASDLDVTVTVQGDFRPSE